MEVGEAVVEGGEVLLDLRQLLLGGAEGGVVGGVGGDGETRAVPEGGGEGLER